MKIKLRKTISILLTVILILSIFNFVGCAQEQPIYRQELVVVPIVYEDMGNVDKVILTKEENKKEQYVGIYPYAFFKIRAYVQVYRYNGKTGSWITKPQIPLTMDSDFDWSYKYEIETVDGEIIERYFTTETLLIDADSKEGGSVLLCNDGLEHKITYNIPKVEKYNIEEMEYEVNLTLTVDKRKKQAEIFLANIDATKVYTAQKVGEYDVYTVKSEPNFDVRDEITKEIIERGSLHVSYRKMDDLFGSTDEKIDIYGKGLYFCNTYFAGDTKKIFDQSDFDDLYKVAWYRCYIVYV